MIKWIANKLGLTTKANKEAYVSARQLKAHVEKLANLDLKSGPKREKTQLIKERFELILKLEGAWYTSTATEMEKLLDDVIYGCSSLDEEINQNYTHLIDPLIRMMLFDNKSRQAIIDKRNRENEGMENEDR